MRAVVVTAVLVLSCVQGDALGEGDELVVVGGPCEGCETVAEGMPRELSSVGTIAPSSEPGVRMTIRGRVLDSSGEAVQGVIVYAYHTDDGGVYPRNGSGSHRHGRLRGWARSDAEGRYAFETIRPGGYPGSTSPAHVHMHVIEESGCSYYIDDILFTDDPRLDAAARRQMARGRGGNGIVTPTSEPDGSITVVRDIVLGAAIRDYERCRELAASRPRP